MKTYVFESTWKSAMTTYIIIHGHRGTSKPVLDTFTLNPLYWGGGGGVAGSPEIGWWPSTGNMF